MTAPLRTFLSLVRTNAPPLPGLTCWNSTTVNSPSGRSRVMPFFRSLVETVIRPSGYQPLQPQPGGHRFDGQAVPVAAEADDRPGGDRRDDRRVAPGLAGVRVGQVQLHDRPLEGGEGVVERPRIVGERARVDDDRCAPAPPGVDRLDEL